jgi:predicted histidine transporter YuiF (NhaC family)
MKKTLTLLFAAAALGFGATFTGVITDNMCDNADHKDMKMGVDAKCVVECVKGMNGKYVLYDASAKKVYKLSDQKTPEKFAAKKVTVTGTVEGDTITVASIVAAK